MKWTYRAEYVRCGRKCSGCPHGPYWYAYRREGGRLRKRYVGKVRPEESLKTDPRDAIFDWATATVSLALMILGCTPDSCRGSVLDAYRELVKENHPDRGGDEKESRLINAAWSYLQATKGW